MHPVFHMKSNKWNRLFYYKPLLSVTYCEKIGEFLSVTRGKLTSLVQPNILEINYCYDTIDLGVNVCGQLLQTKHIAAENVVHRCL